MDLFHVADCCRACLKTKCSLIETTSLDQDSIKLSDKLTACVSEVMWLKEGLPYLICSDCIESLRVAYDFRKVCLQSDQTFSRFISQMKDKNMSEESQDGTTSPLEVEAKFDFTNTQVIPDILPCLKEEPPNSPEMHSNDVDWLEKSKDFNETGESKNSALESENWVDVEKLDLKPLIDAVDRQHNIEQPESAQVAQTAQLDQQQKLTHQQNESQLQQQMHIQQQSSQQKQVIKLTTGGQQRLSSLENITLDGAQSKGYTCAVCGETFREHATLRVHMRIHTGEKPVQCTVSCKLCDAKFTCSSLLSVHMREHKDEQSKQAGLHLPEDVTLNSEKSKSYTCMVCSKAYQHNSSLTKHMRTHTGERPYSCDTCGKQFTTYDSLRFHIGTHTGVRPFACKICGKSFVQSERFRIHMKTHTGERPYSCDTCGKTFTTWASCQYHKETHTEVKPFTCKICEKSFRRSFHLNYHMRKHAG